jgi:hypothetical protein
MDLLTHVRVPVSRRSAPMSRAGLGESRRSGYRSIERGDLPLSVSRVNGHPLIARGAVERLVAGEPSTLADYIIPCACTFFVARCACN